MPNIELTQEQFKTLLAEVQKPAADAKPAAGLGAPHRTAGLGSFPQGDLEASVGCLLASGSPRLALARALGVPLAPYLINVRAKFPDTSVQIVPDVGSDVKIVQDTLIDAMVVRIFNESLTANQNQFQAQSDFFFTLQSGIEAKLDVVGAPRYSVAPTFTPLANLLDTINGNSHWPRGWVLTYQQQLMMNFIPKVTLPFTPLEVVCTFRGWIPTNEMFVSMTNREAIEKLETDCGIPLDPAYKKRLLGGV